MKAVLFVSVVAVSAAGCSQSEFKAGLKNATDVEVMFYHPGTDSATRIVKAKDKNAVNKLIDFADGKKIDKANCVADGKMMFSEGDRKMAEVRFSFRDENCRVFFHDDENRVTKLTREASDFLLSLEKGLNTY